MSERREWFREAFDDLYLTVYRHRDPDEDTPQWPVRGDLDPGSEAGATPNRTGRPKAPGDRESAPIRPSRRRHRKRHRSPRCGLAGHAELNQVLSRVEEPGWHHKGTILSIRLPGHEPD